MPRPAGRGRRAGYRGAENNQNSVPDKFIDGALILEDNLGHNLEIDIDNPDDAFGGQVFGEGSKATQVAH